MVCANKINAISFTLCKLKREFERLTLSLGPWAQWYSVYLSLLHAQREVPSFFGNALVAVTDRLLVASQEYLEVVHKCPESHESKTLYVYTNVNLWLFVPEDLIVFVDPIALSKVVKLTPGGVIEVTGELTGADDVVTGNFTSLCVKGLKEGNLNVREVKQSQSVSDGTDQNVEEGVEEECEPFESSEPFETVDFTTTTDIDGQNIQEVEKRLRQILDVTETNTEVTEQ